MAIGHLLRSSGPTEGLPFLRWCTPTSCPLLSYRSRTLFRSLLEYADPLESQLDERRYKNKPSLSRV